MARFSLIALLTCVLASGAPQALAQSTSYREGLLDGSLNLSDIPEHRKTVLEEWLALKLKRLRNRAERSHDPDEPPLEFEPIENLTSDEILIEVRELLGAEGTGTAEEPTAADDAPCGALQYECFVPTPPKITSKSYDPADVDWAGLIQTVKNICAFEPRFCTFAIRTFFHDSGSFTGGDASATDASVILNDLETMLEDNTQAGFAPYARAILAHLGAFYGPSATDLLTVVAAYSPVALGGNVDPAFDHRNAVNLFVGRLDSKSDASMEAIRAMHEVLPQEFDATPKFLAFWDESLSPHVNPPPTANPAHSWHFRTRDIAALMGAHTLMDNFGCQDGCDGEKKALVWNNDWYKDMNSGSCTPRKPPPIGDDKKPLNADGGKGRTPSADERRAMRECTFKSAAGLELADHLQCEIDSMRGTAENPGHQAGFSFQFVDWRPTDSRSACCGDDTCDPCEAGSDAWWCEGGDEGTVHWPYTWADCELSFAIAQTAGPGPRYCDKREGIQYAHEVDCSEMGEDLALRQSLQLLSSNQRTDDGPPMEFFERDTDKWTHYFNKGVNKLSALGATWSDNPRVLLTLVGCSGKSLCEGEVMPVPEGVCPPLAAIFRSTAAVPASTTSLDVVIVDDDY